MISLPLHETVNGLLAAGGAGVPPEPAQQAITYPSLFVLVAVGALLPVVPTGAVVSGAAVVALHQSLPVVSMLCVLAVASLAAFAGDSALYWLGSRGVGSAGGSRWLDRLRERASPERLERAQQRLRDHGTALLVLSRLLPAGRIPVMLACLLAHMPLREFARGNASACLAWTVTYQVIGVLGGSLFPQPWEGVAAAVLLTAGVGAAPAVWRRLRRGRGGQGMSAK